MLSLIISCTLSRKFQDILDCRRCCYFFFVYDANANVGNGMAWDVTAETIRCDTIRKKSLTWTQKLRISFINLAHVARKNKKKKLKQTNAILADSYVSASNRSVTQLCDLGRERRRSSVEGGAADRLLAECISQCAAICTTSDSFPCMYVRRRRLRSADTRTLVVGGIQSSFGDIRCVSTSIGSGIVCYLI